MFRLTNPLHRASLSPSLSDMPNAHEKPLDIVIKTRAKDLYTFMRLQQDILRHSRLSGKVYVVVHRRDLAAYEKIVHPNFVLTTMNRVLEPFGYREDLPDTWSTQQIIKLLAASTVGNEQYLIIDANTLINYDFDENNFYRDGHYIYAVNDLTDKDWDVQARRFLRLDPEGILFGFRSTNQIFFKSNVFRLVAYLAKLYGRNVVETLSSQPDDWTEFKLYGYYCRCILRDTGHFFQQTGDVTSINKLNVDVPSYLSWLKFSRPLMIKVYKHRPTHQLSEEEYDEFVAQIKRVYQRKLKPPVCAAQEAAAAYEQA